jgi:hypothetical protein
MQEQVNFVLFGFQIRAHFLRVSLSFFCEATRFINIDAVFTDVFGFSVPKDVNLHA